MVAQGFHLTFSKEKQKSMKKFISISQANKTLAFKLFRISVFSKVSEQANKRVPLDPGKMVLEQMSMESPEEAA